MKKRPNILNRDHRLDRRAIKTAIRIMTAIIRTFTCAPEAMVAIIKSGGAQPWLGVGCETADTAASVLIASGFHRKTPRKLEIERRWIAPGVLACLLGKAYYYLMDCAECEELKRRQAAATVKYVEADQRRKAYVPAGPLSGRDISELAYLDQEVENAMRKRDDLAKEYARHRRDVHTKRIAS